MSVSLAYRCGYVDYMQKNSRNIENVNNLGI